MFSVGTKIVFMFYDTAKVVKISGHISHLVLGEVQSAFKV